MRVGDLIKRPPVVQLPSASIKQAAELMVKERVGLLIIVDPSNTRVPIGVVSERDILSAVARGLDYGTEISKLMNKPITINANASLAEAARKMREHNIRHLVVVDDWGKLVGAISIRDLIYEKGALLALAEEVRREAPTTP